MSTLPDDSSRAEAWRHILTHEQFLAKFLGRSERNRLGDSRRSGGGREKQESGGGEGEEGGSDEKDELKEEMGGKETLIGGANVECERAETAGAFFKDGVVI